MGDGVAGAGPGSVRLGAVPLPGGRASMGGGGELAGMHWKGGGYPSPLQGAQTLPSHCLPDAKCQLQRHL